MGAKFKIVSTILMFILIAMLFGILINYYNEPVEIQNNSLVNSYANTNLKLPVESVINENESGDVLSGDIESGEQYIKSGDNNFNEVSSGESEIEKVIAESNPVISSQPPTTPIIISSESTMTDEEKKEILTDLDNTLKELLEVVDKVQTVDETRLITEQEGEVQ